MHSVREINQCYSGGLGQLELFILVESELTLNKRNEFLYYRDTIEKY